jgi:protein-tyrosine phosphatase
MQDQENQAVRVLFVCLGNICRSPMAEGVFRSLVEAAGAAERVIIDSAGTSDYHAGHSPDQRAQRTLRSRNIDISRLRARQVTEADFEAFDHIFAMDRTNLEKLISSAPAEHRAKIRLFLDLAPDAGVREVPDPYFGGDEGFGHVLALIDMASSRLLAELDITAPPNSKAPQR